MTPRLLAITPRDPSGRGNPSGDSIDARARTTREHVDVEVMSSSSVPISLVEDQDVRVRVTFRYPCAIPFAGPLVCGGMTNETIAEATLGRGTLYLFTPEITFRGQPAGTFPLLFNAIWRAGASR